jgi:hypothetical protein
MKSCLVVACSVILTISACKKTADIAGPSNIPANDLLPADHYSISDKDLLNQVQLSTFRYFWDYFHPFSGMARERTNSGDIVTTGGTGFGIAAMVVACSREWISRNEAATRIDQICNFLSKADRFHGAWSHWINGSTGKAIPFSQYDNGGDLVETSYLINGLLIAKEYFNSDNNQETALRTTIDSLWQTVEWNWYASRGDNKLYWHWSPDYAWQMNTPITGWNEALITYVLAIASPTHPITPSVYQSGWVTSLFSETKNHEGYSLSLGPEYGGPLFFAHYSFIGLDPRLMQDSYANYWQHNTKQSLINRSYCVYSAPSVYQYKTNIWGLTASDNPDGYSAQQPNNDNGTISPTAAISSIVYTPYYSLQVMHQLYEKMKDKTWGEYGFYDAFNVSRNWYSNQYLAIDQGPEICMIENYRSGLLWNLFMKIPEIKNALNSINITEGRYETGFYLSVPNVKTGKVDLTKHPDKECYLIDIYLESAGIYTLTLKKSDGSIVETIWNKISQPSGKLVVEFGNNVQSGFYTLNLENEDTNKTLSIALH